jgi:DNA repair exonuclease SbcCD ATPase subunit
MRSEMPLRRQREMRELEVRSKESRQKTELLAVERQERLDEIRRLEERMEMTRSDTHRREIENHRTGTRTAPHRNGAGPRKGTSYSADEELIRLQDGMGKLMEEKRNLEKERQELDEKSESNQRRLMEIQESLQDSAHKRDMAAQELTAVKVEAARVREQRNHLQSSLEQARLRLEELERHPNVCV